MTMTHSLAAWRDEMIDEATHKATREEDIRIANALRAKGMDVNEIAELTGLTIDEILQM